MKKNLSIILLLFSLYSKADAQFHLDLDAGVATNGLSALSSNVNPLIAGSVPLTNQGGFSCGINLFHGFSTHFGMQTGLNYENFIASYDEFYNEKISLEYINLPVIAMYSPGESEDYDFKFWLFAGPQLNFLAGGTATADDTSFVSNFNKRITNFKTYDVSAVFGMEFARRPVDLRIYYQKGLTNLYPGSNIYVNSVIVKLGIYIGR